MSSIKLTADSGGVATSLKAPASGSNARVLTVPDTASGTVLTTTNPKAGNIIQVVHANTGTQTTTSANSYTNSGLTASITPSSSSSKILVSVCQAYRLAIGGATAASGAIKIFREQGGTETAVSSPQDYFLYVEAAGTTSQYVYDVMTQIVQDSPNTTSAVSYKTKQRIYNSMGTIITQYNGDSYITLMEIAA